MNIDRFSVGQGGFSPERMFSDRMAEVRALKPRVIRLFVQEYYDLLPDPHRYHFELLDRSVDSILDAGATPLLCVALKPKLLFPEISQALVVPTRWTDWDSLIYHLVLHYKERNGAGWYWEIGNEWNRPDGGGTPYHMTPRQYVTFYSHTVSAIRRADPEARVGGPAQGDGPPSTALISALLSFCNDNARPLDFVSWHHYPNDPHWFRSSVNSMRGLLRRYPRLHPDLVIDEWNMGFNNDLRIQPAYVLEATYQMIEAGLDLSCYYQIRDYPFSQANLLHFYPARLVEEQQKFWNRHPVSYGLFDYQNRVRPAYFAFVLLKRLTGERCAVSSGSPTIHALATSDDHIGRSSILLWNYSDHAVTINLDLVGLAEYTFVRRLVLDVNGRSYDQNLNTKSVRKLSEYRQSSFPLQPWGITFIALGAR